MDTFTTLFIKVDSAPIPPMMWSRFNSWKLGFIMGNAMIHTSNSCPTLSSIPWRLHASNMVQERRASGHGATIPIPTPEDG
eukprot:scaffold25121_cov35-Attheya_sp.AAC.1